MNVCPTKFIPLSDVHMTDTWFTPDNRIEMSVERVDVISDSVGICMYSTWLMTLMRGLFKGIIRELTKCEQCQPTLKRGRIDTHGSEDFLDRPTKDSWPTYAR